MEKKGLTSAEAKRLLEEHGPNALPETPPPSSLEILISQLKSPLVYVLVAAAAITAFLQEWPDTIIISAAIIINTVLGFIQEKRASNALQALKNLIHPTALVIRDGEQKEIPIEDVVPGDICVLNNGEKIPADGTVVEDTHFFVEEAILTGESLPVEKKKQDKVFMGTIVTAGRAFMKVDYTGEHTEIGKIAESVQTQEEETPLKKQLKVFSKQLTYVVLGLTVFVVIVGALSGKELTDVFLTSVALAVSAIPEGLLIALTVVLAIGMQRILKRKGLVRNLVSAETLGSVTTICTDKTGTLTEGKMKVVETVGDLDDLSLQAILTNDQDDPIVIAAWDWSTDLVKDYKEKLKKYPRLDELPFDPKERFSATLHKMDKKNKILVNGAAEYLLEWCDISKIEKQEMLKKIEGYSKQGMRLMGMASKEISNSKSKISSKDVINNKLKWEGLLVYSDPVRNGVKEALEKTKSAGIRLIVITGDYKNTALSVLKQLNVEVNLDFVIEGKEIEKFSNIELSKFLNNKESILFARTSPQEKLKIIEALKQNGEIVSMTGDGVNDAPALAKSDIGVVVGEATDVAKESADLVLLDSSFATIVEAIEEGRGIFNNIRKIILYLMSDAFAAIITVIGAIILGLPLPLSAAQILWINLISDGLPDLALTMDPKKKNIMSEPPRNPKEKLVSTWMKDLILMISAFGGLSTLGAFAWILNTGGSLEFARSVAFAILGINSLVYVFSIRTLTDPFWNENPLENKWLNFAVLGGFTIFIIPFVIPNLSELFKIQSLPLNYWLIIAFVSVVMFVLIEVSKWVFRHRFNIN